MSTLRIARGDLKWVSKDWQAVLWMLVMPLICAFILGSMFRNRPLQATWIPVVDLDRSPLSQLFIEQMTEEGYDLDVMGHEEEHHLQEGSWFYALAIPPKFGERILTGERVKITVVNKNGSPEQILEVQLCLMHAIMRFARGLAWADASGRVGTEERRQALRESLSRAPLLSVERKGHRSLRPLPVGFYLSLPGFLVMFVLLTIVVAGGATMVDDRMQGRFARLFAAPLSAFEVYAGKILARILLALVQAFLVLACGSLLFKLQLGDSPMFLLPVILSLAALAGCLSMLCGILCQTEKQVLHVAIFVAVVLAALGGCWWPIEIVPEFFKRVAMVTPSYWAVQGLQRVMYFNKSHEVLTLECPILLSYAAGVMVVVLLFLRRSPGRGAKS